VSERGLEILFALVVGITVVAMVVLLIILVIRIGAR